MNLRPSPSTFRLEQLRLSLSIVCCACLRLLSLPPLLLLLFLCIVLCLDLYHLFGSRSRDVPFTLEDAHLLRCLLPGCQWSFWCSRSDFRFSAFWSCHHPSKSFAGECQPRESLTLHVENIKQLCDFRAPDTCVPRYISHPRPSNTSHGYHTVQLLHGHE